jgi:deoxyribose-phosphate aldolase
MNPLILKCRALLREQNMLSKNLAEDFPLGNCVPPENFTDVHHYVDLTNLKPQATITDIEELCAKARQQQVAAVCTFQKFTNHASKLLAGSNIDICAVANFPGAGSDVSVVQADVAFSVKNGATEIDPVHRIDLIKEKRYSEYLEFMQAVVKSAKNARVKVIFETQLLTDEEIVISALLCWMAGVRGIKTSTGVNTFVSDGEKQTVHATVHHICLMRMAFGDVDKFGNPAIIKASGGVGDEFKARELLENGATRIGASGL